MVRKLLLVSALAATTALFAQTTTIPTLEEMAGDFLVMNSRVYNEASYLAEMKPFTITISDDSLYVSGFYIKQGLDFKADYDATTGTISIPPATPVLDMQTYMIYLYPWNDATEEIINRPIEYQYAGDDTWVCSTTIMLVAIRGEEIQPYYFSEGSEIARCNGTVNNVSYAGSGEDQMEYVESRAAYVTMQGDRIDIYNFLQIDQYGYGAHLVGVYMEDNKEAWFSPTTTGQSNDGTYRVLTGCEYDETTNLPTGLSYADTELESYIRADVDMENGKFVFDPMAIFAANYDSTTGMLTIDESLSLFEFVKSVEMTCDIKVLPVSAIDTPEADLAKEVERVDLYTLDGRKVAAPRDGTFVIKLTTYTDKSTKAEKMIFRNR